MGNNYKGVSYFETRPDVVKIFDDLDAFRDFCRFEMCEFNEAHLYNRQSEIWNRFSYFNRPRKQREWNNNREYNRGGNNRKFQRQ